MTADLLRRAAEKLRAQAEGVMHFTSPWRTVPDPDGNHTIQYATDNPLAGHLASTADYGGLALPDYIATMHPGVAVTVANWLAREARYASRIGDDAYTHDAGVPNSEGRDALAVARAVLGDDT